MTINQPSDSERFLQSAVHILKAGMFLAHDNDIDHNTLINSLKGARLLIDGVIERADGQCGSDTGLLLRASRMLEVCIIGIRDVESHVKMLVAFARIQAAVRWIDEARRAGDESASILAGYAPGTPTYTVTDTGVEMPADSRFRDICERR